MQVAVLHDVVSREDAGPDQTDVLVQAESVSAALRELGYDPITISASLDFSALTRTLKDLRPSFIFNLVESVEGHGRLIYLPPAIFDCLRIPYTGAGTDAIYLTTNKPAAKKALAGCSIKTPHYYSEKTFERAPGFLPGLYIVKAVWEHASIGLDEESVITAEDPSDLLARIREMEARLGTDCFAESYVEGREFNLSVLAGEKGPQVLPPAEIRFESYPEGMRRIVGYRAKWLENSFEYLHTNRSFDFPAPDDALLQSLAEIAARCWNLFDLRGYARVDFRVDAEGIPWVLEVNANPCLSPDAGFAAAAKRAGLSFTGVVERIIQDTEGLKKS
ncbi:MAG: D-alanine--D-alanine ligase [Desulfobacteraceae bacterium]|nr:MAG: D-alanine--D-alanine ligase [Desulfobacteraceae bacterium]